MLREVKEEVSEEEKRKIFDVHFKGELEKINKLLEMSREREEEEFEAIKDNYLFLMREINNQGLPETKKMCDT